MNAFAPYMAALHQQDLLEEAELLRTFKELRGSQSRVPAWRRGLGNVARGLSRLFAFAARSLDPSVEAARAGHGHVEGGGARAIAA